MNSAVKFIFCCALSSLCLTACGGDSGSGSENPGTEKPGSENGGSENGGSSKNGSDSHDVDVKSSDDPVIWSGIQDSRTGQTIETVQIGMYIWMTKNVNNSGWGTSSVCYDDDSENCDTYGKLFESSSANTACPTGFDVPLKRDWKWLGHYSATYPTAASALQLNYGGSCSDKSGPLNCKGLGETGKYLAQDGIAVFTSKSVSPAFEEEQLHSYYQLRCMTYNEQDGRLAGIQSRYLGENKKAPRFQFLSSQKTRLFNLPILNTLKRGDSLYITEGITDCLAMLSTGLNAVAIPSATIQPLEDLILLKNYELHMYPDQDEAGRRAFMEIRRFFVQHYTTVKEEQLPEGAKDYCDYYISIRETDGKE